MAEHHIGPSGTGPKQHWLAIYQLLPTRSSSRASVLGLLTLLCMVLLLSCGAPPVTTGQVVPIQQPSAVATSVPASPTASPTPPPTRGEFQSPLISPVATLPTASPTPVPTREEFQSPLISPVATPPATTLPETPVYTYRIVNVFPHDRGAFTEGLVFKEGVLYEGTGLLGQSTLRRITLESGEVLQIRSLPPEYFGEGITIWEDRIVQLTWQSGQGFVYDQTSFELLDTFSYATEGWGITHDGEKLMMSDGTSTLHFWDPETFEEIGYVQVRDDKGPVAMLNELEYVGGVVYANVWQTDRIAIIDPQTGWVNGWIDLAGLLEPEDYVQAVDVLNGIAYDEVSDRLWVTGKKWPKLFEIELVPAE